ncbi:DMT family transporter [Marinibaculum pumilum]|uniref:DMT family transporter n=1 Tax=Marinibaculum pumilum TaxID=1766165 RepID=A0ABV7KUW1_9PROT
MIALPGLRRAGRTDYLLLALLSLQWSTAYLFIDLAADDVPPATISAVRNLGGAIALLTLARILGERFPRDWRMLAVFPVTGFLGSFLPFVLLGRAAQSVDSGLIAILVGFMPLAAFIAAHLLTEDEKLTGRRLLGIMVGMAGIVWLVGPQALESLGVGSEAQMIGQFAALGSALSWAVGNLVARRISGVPLVTAAACVLLGGSLYAVPASLVFDAPWTLELSDTAIIGLVGLTFWTSASASIVFVRLVTTIGATFVAWSNFVNPVLGVIWGALFLGEALPLRAFLVLGLILLGIAVAQLPLAAIFRRRPPGGAKP